MSDKHLVLAIEVPGFYTKDIDIPAERAEFFADSSMSDTEILLGHMGAPGLVKLTMEVSGEKDSEVIEVLGDIRSATLEEPSPGVTDDELQEGAWKLQVDQDEAIEVAVRRLRREGVPISEIIELLEGEIVDLRREELSDRAADIEKLKKNAAAYTIQPDDIAELEQTGFVTLKILDGSEVSLSLDKEA